MITSLSTVVKRIEKHATKMAEQKTKPRKRGRPMRHTNARLSG
jgi:hypothetical protein